MKVSELTGARLDYWVAHATGQEASVQDWGIGAPELTCVLADSGNAYHPSTDWREGGEIIESERIATFYGDGEWGAEALDPHNANWIDTNTYDCTATGPTPLVAAMRALVTLKYGVTVPDE